MWEIFLQLIIFASVLACFLFLVFIFLKSSRQKNHPEGIFLELSNSFKKEIESLIKEEISFAGKEFREKLKNFSIDLLSQYQKNTEKILQEISLITPEFKTTLTKKTEVGISTFFEEIKKSASKIEKVAEKASVSLSEASQEKIKQIEEEIKKIFQNLNSQVEKKYSEIENYLEDYKKEKIKEIDEKIFQILSEVAIKTLGRAIDLSTHEELVIRALEKAKKEKLF